MVLVWDEPLNRMSGIHILRGSLLEWIWQRGCLCGWQLNCCTSSGSLVVACLRALPLLFLSPSHPPSLFPSLSFKHMYEQMDLCTCLLKGSQRTKWIRLDYAGTWLAGTFTVLADVFASVNTNSGNCRSIPWSHCVTWLVLLLAGWITLRIRSMRVWRSSMCLCWPMCCAGQL